MFEEPHNLLFYPKRLSMNPNIQVQIMCARCLYLIQRNVCRLLGNPKQKKALKKSALVSKNKLIKSNILSQEKV